MEESEENMSSDDFIKVESSSGVKRPKKRSIVERELETNLTARVTSPVTHSEGSNLSRYGRARKLKSDEGLDRKPPLDIKSPGTENTPIKPQSPVYKMHAMNTPYKSETPKRALETTLNNQIDHIYQENISLSRFHAENQSSSPKKSKVYIRKDLIQTKEEEDNIVLIKNLFTSPKSASKRSVEPKPRSVEPKPRSVESKTRSAEKLNRSIEKFNRSVEKFNESVSVEKKYKPQNGFDNTSVVKMLDFDGKRKKDKHSKALSKNELFEIEALCPLQVGDLAWARMGTFPFWPCIVTRDPMTGMFVRKKLFGRVEHNVIHVTFFGDNGRRSWIVDNMLREYFGLQEFENARENFTTEEKKRDPRLYAAFFISEKKQSLWKTSVDEAETLLKEPKRLRIDILNDMILRSRASKKQLRSGKVSRTDSDVSLSESLYDSLFSEEDTTSDDVGRLRNRSRNKSLDVSDVVTACLDNMAAKTGMTNIQRQSHMDRWLQKAKSKTPEKNQNKTPLIVPKVEKTSRSRNKKKNRPINDYVKSYSLRRSNEPKVEPQTNYGAESPTYTQPFDEDIKPAIETLINNTSQGSNIEPEHNRSNTSEIDYSNIDVKLELMEQENSTDQNNMSANPEQTVDDINLDTSTEIVDKSNDNHQVSRGSNIDQSTVDKVVNGANGKENSIEQSNTIEDREEVYKVLDRENLITDGTLKIKEEAILNEENEEEISEKLLLEEKTEKINEDILLNDHNSSNENEAISKVPESDKDSNIVTNSDLESNSLALVSGKNGQNKSESILTGDKTLDYKEVAPDEAGSDNLCDSSQILDNSHDQTKQCDQNIVKLNSVSDPKTIEDNRGSNKTHDDLRDPQSDVNNKELEDKEDFKDDSHMSVDDSKNDSTLNEDNDLTMEEENALLNVSGDSESISHVNGDDNFYKNKDGNIKNGNEGEKMNINKNEVQKKNFEQLGPMLVKDINKHFEDSAYNSESVPEAKKSTKNTKINISNTKYTEDVKSDANRQTDNKERLRLEAIVDNKEANKPTNGDNDQINKKVDLTEDKSDYETEESDDEPSPEYESLDEDITEDFRKHMQTIENSITDKKDEAMIVKVCAKIEEEISKTSPIKDSVKSSIKPEGIKLSNSKNLTPEINAKVNHDSTQNTRRTRNSIKKMNEQYNHGISIDSPTVMTSKTIQNGDISPRNVDSKRKSNVNIKENSIIDRSKAEPKVVIIPLEQNKTFNQNIARKSSIESVSSKSNKSSPKTSKLSLKRNKTKSNDPPPTQQDSPFKHSILNHKLSMRIPKIVPIDNNSAETSIPETKQNGYHYPVDRQFTETPDIDDDDFDIDAVSVNSEDSEISLSNTNKHQPRRSLRSKPHYENALENPEFLKYLELRQDHLMDEHPELTQDEIVAYLNKTWLYEESLKSDAKKSDDVHHSNLIKGIKQETPTSKKSKKSQPKNRIENYFRENYNKKKIDFDSGNSMTDSSVAHSSRSDIESTLDIKDEIVPINGSKSPRTSLTIDLTEEPDVKTEAIEPDITIKEEKDTSVKETLKDTVLKETTPKRSRRSKTQSPKVSKEKTPITILKQETNEIQDDIESINSEDSEVPLRKLRSKVLKDNQLNGLKSPELELKKENEDAVSIISINSDDEPLLNKLRRRRNDRKVENGLEHPDFLKFLELRQDAIMDENPQLSQEEIVDYLYKTWLYEENNKSEYKKNDEIEQSNLVKGLNQDPLPKKVKRKPKADKPAEKLEETSVKEKPKRKTIQPYYNEDYSDVEEELEVFEIFKTKKTPITIVSKSDPEKTVVKSENTTDVNETDEKITDTITEISDYIPNEVQIMDEIELYFTELTKPKPNVFKGLIREKVCEVCENTGNLYKCKGCNGMFHVDCVKKVSEVVEQPLPTSRGRKKKKKLGRKQKSIEGSETHEDKVQEIEEVPLEENLEICTFDAETIEAQLATKMQEIMNSTELQYDSYSSDEGVDWSDTVAGKCEIVDIKLKPRSVPIDINDFKCHNCQKYDTPVCFVCKSAVTKNDVTVRQKCHVAHCQKYYHLKCLDHWPQTQFNSGEPSKTNKKINEYFEALTCPRHVCHTCVCDDPRGCKTRFSGDKLARCVRCPATYHSFTKCLPAGTVILSASQIICPRHYQLRPGKVPCHVNTGWCFICALGGSLICCEYCPTSFHAECLNIKPPEGNYMCEDCETGRLPLYGEMVWVKLGHYRWWPGIILHPCEIPENIMAVKHSLGEFVVRFFGQYDHYWVNRGRVFPYQEGDSGRISSQKSKIDAAFTTAMVHAQRAFEILKRAQPNEEESLDIASSLLPPHYVKLKCNKPCGAVSGKRVDDTSGVTQCECDPAQADPCGPYSQCLNRMLLTECGPWCRAGERCNNRAFEKRLYPRLTPYRTPHRGWGLKTLDDIKAGQFVIEYVGELIDEEEFKRRMRRKHEIRDENFYFLTLDKERMIDAGPKGNSARFMNHCCEPNCETQKWTVLGDVRVGLFAIDDIPANSEVTFNYNLECAGIEKKRCLCGAKRCSGYIGAKPKQDESQSKKAKDGKPIAKRTYKKRKHNEDSPSTSKNKPKKPVGRPPKPKELTEIEKDLLIIKSASNSVSSVCDESCSSTQTLDEKSIEKPAKTVKRKWDFNTTDVSSLPSEAKRQKCDTEVGD